MILIREAKKEDCKAMMDLIVELAIFEKEPDAVIVSLQQFEAAGFGESPVYKALVACNEDDIIVGFALYYIRYSTWKGSRMYLEDLLVTEKFRGKGIGSLLFDKLLEVARKEKFTGVVWQVLDWNEPAINFYEKYKSSFDKGWVNCSIDL
jgi:GNAT superfamily N-acetyltransferase